MPQQINLYTPILLTQKQYFSSRSMALALLVFVVLGGALCSYQVWSLNESSESLTRELTQRGAEREMLLNAIKTRKVDAAPSVDVALRELKAAEAELQKREALLEDLRRGLVVAERGHAARMRLVAQSIPAAVWLTEIFADDRRLEVHGFTKEPSTLNEWVARLGQSPLLKGQSLVAVKVERSMADGGPVWSFSLVSAASVPATSASAPVIAASGGRP
jgi:Tfp pilus assembly protein PilN